MSVQRQRKSPRTLFSGSCQLILKIATLDAIIPGNQGESCEYDSQGIRTRFSSRRGLPLPDHYLCFLCSGLPCCPLSPSMVFSSSRTVASTCSSLFWKKYRGSSSKASPGAAVVTAMSLLPSQRRPPSTTGSVKHAMTLTEKILARASERVRLVPGENVLVNVDVLMIHDVTGPGAIGTFRREFGDVANVKLFLEF